MSLAEAREAALEARRQVKAGVNPIEARRAAKLAAAPGKTFGDVADAFFAAKQSEYSNPKYAEMTRLALTRTVATIRPLPVDRVATEDVLGVLKPLWLETPKTARRVREKVEAVLDFAGVHGLRQGDNPARWRGHLEHLLPRHDKRQQGHHAALPYKDAPAFFARLRGVEGVAPRALEFTILTAARTGEVLGAKWDEIDFAENLWIVPKARMKGAKEHRVPLTPRALEILETMQRHRVSDYIFPGRDRGKPLSHIAMAHVIRRMGVEAVTVHGFRSSFRDWCGDCTDFPRDVAEAALAHAIRSDVEAAYRRGDALAKRRELMDAWAAYCCGGVA